MSGLGSAVKHDGIIVSLLHDPPSPLSSSFPLQTGPPPTTAGGSGGVMA